MTSYSMERKGTEYIVHLPLLTSVTYERPTVFADVRSQMSDVYKMDDV